MLETKIKAIYLHLQDEVSRQLFQKRLMYSLTGDKCFMEQIIDSLLQKKEIDALVEKAEQVKEKLIVYGAGNDLVMLSRLYPNFSCVCLCDGDSNKCVTGWKGYHVISPEQLLTDYREYYVLISTTAFQKEIYERLIKSGWNKEKILNVGAVAVSQELYQQQYFDEEIMKPGWDEIFIDGGCYDCSTDKLFAKWCGGYYKKIYAFEPDEKNYENCRAVGETIQNIKLINKGLWSCEDVLRFEANASPGAKIVTTEMQDVTLVRVTSIDEVVKDEKVTFIKMDIEGAELEALKGARRIIKKHHPRLAISIYHKPEDIWEIPGYILSLSDDYRFYIRHYRLNANETVLYAV